jgi:hypothetical protein
MRYKISPFKSSASIRRIRAAPASAVNNLFHEHTPSWRNLSPQSDFCLSSETRLSDVLLARGFASQPHGWFAFIEVVSVEKLLKAWSKCVASGLRCTFWSVLGSV